MTQRILGAAAAAFLLLSAAHAAHADVLKTRDGKWWPKKIQADMEGQDAPSDDVLKKSGRNNLDLTYDDVTISGQKFSAAEVEEVYSTTAYESLSYKNGERQAQSRYWAEAAANFAEAAENLKGSGKEIALYWRAWCLVRTNDAAKTFDAAQELLDAFPKTYYFAKVHDMRARILINRGDRRDAENELNKVINAPGMNPRDYFEAKLAVIYLFKFKAAGKDKKKYAQARADYERVASEIKARNATNAAGIQLLKAQVGQGKCHVYEGDFGEALPHFAAVINDNRSLDDQGLLAQAYTGRGDVRYAMIKKELSGGNVPEDQLGRITEALTDAALDYVRVAQFYVESAGDDLYPATIGAARVWATHFTLTGEKDCDLAQRAAKYFFTAHKMLPRGETRRLLTNEVKRFLAKRDDACKAATPTPPK
jgi:tetratricopeptide (TPR) repeat protein